MIERLATTLRALVEHPAAAADARCRADCADAVRLELDCPQLALTPLQRSSLELLHDRIEEPFPAADDVASAARIAATALGLLS